MGCHFLLQCMKVKSEREVIQSCATLSDPMDCSLPGSSVHGIFQARVLEWGAITFMEQVTWLKKWLFQCGLSFFDLLHAFDCFGSWEPWLWSASQTLGIILLITIMAVSLVCSMLSNTLSACLQPLIIKQMISLRLEHQRRNEVNDQLKNCESEVMTCKQNSQQKTLWPVNNKQRVNKSCENRRDMIESSLQALKFDHTSQAGSHEQKGRIVKRQIKK